MANFIRSIIENDKKELKRLESIVKKIEIIADDMAALTDEQLQAKQLNSKIQKGNIRSAFYQKLSQWFGKQQNAY